MEHYLISLDPKVYADAASAASAITASGAQIEKTYAFGLTYKVHASSSQLDSIQGILTSTLDSVVPVRLEELNTDHLKFTMSVDSSVEYKPKSTGAGVHVYLADTGLRADHSEFFDANINNLYTNFEFYTDNSGHGTAVASLIVGKTVGAAPDAILNVVRLFETSADEIALGKIMDGLEAVFAHHHAQPGNQASVLCTPWTIDRNSFLDWQVAQLQQHGIIVVTAAGNDGIGVEGKSPAGVANAITVGAFNRDFEVTSFTNTPWGSDEISGFVNYGKALDIFALGVDVTVADRNTPDGFMSVTGTSASAGIVAGIFTHFINLYPDRSAQDLKEIVLYAGISAGQQNLVFDESNGDADYSEVYRSIVTTYQSGHNKLSDYPTGRLAMVKAGESVSINVQFNPEATDISVLNFAPLPPWVTLDTQTGELTADASQLAPERVPGIYYFAVRGTVHDTVLVNEWSVVVYNTDPSELTGNDVNAFYYDADLDEYDQITSASSAFIKL